MNGGAIGTAATEHEHVDITTASSTIPFVWECYVKNRRTGMANKRSKWWINKA